MRQVRPSDAYSPPRLPSAISSGSCSSAFEAILGEEMTIGLRKDSVLLLAVGSLKQDIINLELI